MHDDVLLHVFLNFEHLLAMLALELLVTVNLQVRLQLLAGTDRLTADMTNVRILLGLGVFPVHVRLQLLSPFTIEVTLVAVHFVMALLVQRQVVLSLDRLVAAGHVAHPQSVLLLRVLRPDVVADSSDGFAAGCAVEHLLEVNTEMFHYQGPLVLLVRTERAGDFILPLSN